MADQQQQKSTEPHVVGDFDREINFGAIGWFMAVIAVITIASFAGMWYMGVFIESDLARKDPAPSPNLESVDALLPPLPRLQTESYTDWAEMKAAHEAHLSTFAWSDQDNGRVRIPIEEAMQRVAEQGLPNFPKPPLPEPAADGSGTGN